MAKKLKRPFVESIHSNLKSPSPTAESWTVELGQHTLLVGTNTSHKSSVIQAVELALSGSADDIVGRNGVKDPGLLLSLCPQDKLKPGEKKLTAVATLSNDDRPHLRLESKGGVTKRPSHTGPGNHVLVHRAVKEALSGAVDSRRKTFLGWIGGSVSREDMFALIPSNLHSRFADLFDHMGKDKNNIDTLISINNYAAKQSRDLAKQRKGAETVLEGILNVDTGTPPTEDDISRLEQTVEAARHTLEQAAACAHGMPEPVRQHEMAMCEEQLKLSQEIIDRKTAEIEDLKSKAAVVPAYIKSGFDSLVWAVGEGVEQCPTCSSQVGAAHVLTCRDFFGDQLRQIEQSNTAIVSVIQGLEQDLVQATNQYQEQMNHLTTVANTPSRTDAGISMEDARAQLDAASLALNNTMILKSKWDQVIESKELVDNLNGEIEEYKRLKRVCDKTMAEILRLQSDYFVSVVQSHLPDDWEFHIMLYDEQKEKDTFSMGLIRNDELHEALSGAEWATVTTAIAMAVAQINLGKDEPAVLIPEDRAWDGKTLSSVMRSFRSFNGQVIMASTIRPTGRAPAGWTIVDMDKESASWFSEEEAPEEPEAEVRKDDTIRRPRATVATASATAIKMMGFTPDEVKVMSRSTAADIIKKRLKPGDIEVHEDGGYSLVGGGKVLNLPPVPGQ